jgi:hypothetical protein
MEIDVRIRPTDISFDPRAHVLQATWTRARCSMAASFGNSPDSSLGALLLTPSCPVRGRFAGARSSPRRWPPSACAPALQGAGQVVSSAEEGGRHPRIARNVRSTEGLGRHDDHGPTVVGCGGRRNLNDEVLAGIDIPSSARQRKSKLRQSRSGWSHEAGVSQGVCERGLGRPRRVRGFSERAPQWNPWSRPSKTSWRSTRLPRPCGCGTWSIATSISLAS